MLILIDKKKTVVEEAASVGLHQINLHLYVLLRIPVGDIRNLTNQKTVGQALSLVLRQIGLYAHVPTRILLQNTRLSSFFRFFPILRFVIQVECANLWQ